MEICLLLITSYTASTSCEGAKILALATHSYASHIGSMLPYLRNLADTGHSVTVLETSEKKEASNFGRGITTEHIYIPVDPQKTQDATEVIWRNARSGFYIAQVYNNVGDKALQMILKYDPETFSRMLNETWDLIIVDELFTVHGYAIATYHKRFKGTPYIVYSTTVMLSTNSITSALGRCWTCRVHMFFSSVAELSYKPTVFTHRIANFYQQITEYIGLRYFVQWFGMRHMRDIGIADFTWHDYFSGTSAFLGDSIDNVGLPVAEGTEITNVGSICPEVNKTLPDDLEAFVSDSKSRGTIYVAFGTYVRWMKAPESVREAFFSAFAELTNYRVIFAYDGPNDNISTNVFMMKFAPQKEILNDRRTKVFISHGGLKSMKEAICADVPVVYMPIFAEQAHNAIFAKEIGIAETINKIRVTKTTILSALRKVLIHKRYQRNIQKVKQIYLDRIIPASDQSLFVTRRVLKHPDRAISFKRKGIDISWMQFLYIDFLFILLLTFVVLM